MNNVMTNFVIEALQPAQSFQLLVLNKCVSVNDNDKTFKNFRIKISNHIYLLYLSKSPL